jgi:hypothetical protein
LLAPPQEDPVIGRVQFIHESVRQYILHGGLLKVDPTLRNFDPESCHERLSRWCCEYLLLTNCSNLAKRLRPSTDRHEWWRVASNTFPFLRYALDGVLRHADIAAYRGSSRMPFSASLTFVDWLAVKTCTIDIARKHPCHSSRSPSLLHVLVVEDCSHLVDIELAGYSSSLPKELWAHLGAMEEDMEFPITTGSQNRPTKTISASCIGGALHIAASHSSVEIALALIRSGADPNDHCQVVGSPLFVGTRRDNNRAKMVKALLENGARPDGNCTSQCIDCPDNTETPLFNSVGLRDVTSVNLLLRHGADPNAKDIFGTPLRLAIFGGNRDVVRALLEGKADANATFPRCISGCSPLIYAIIENRLHRLGSHACADIVELLLKHGAAINARCERCNTTALDHAMRSRGQRLLVKILRDAGAS